MQILVATDVAARGLDISTVTHVVNYDVRSRPTSTCTASGAPAASGARAARSRSSSRARASELAAIEKHIGQEITPWEAGAHTRPAPVEERPRRHSKPQLSRNGDEPYAKLIASGGRADGVEVSDLVHAVTHEAGVDGEAVRDVKVLERFSVLSVPASDAERIVGRRAVAAPRPRRDLGRLLRRLPLMTVDTLVRDPQRGRRAALRAPARSRPVAPARACGDCGLDGPARTGAWSAARPRPAASAGAPACARPRPSSALTLRARRRRGDRRLRGDQRRRRPRRRQAARGLGRAGRPGAAEHARRAAAGDGRRPRRAAAQA